MHSSGRFYFYDSKTGEEISINFSNAQEGAGRFIGQVKGLNVRDELWVGDARRPQRITIADFPGRECVKVKSWWPGNDHADVEWFYLSSAAALAKYGLGEPQTLCKAVIDLATDQRCGAVATTDDENFAYPMCDEHAQCAYACMDVDELMLANAY